MNIINESFISDLIVLDGKTQTTSISMHSGHHTDRLALIFYNEKKSPIEMNIRVNLPNNIVRKLEDILRESKEKISILINNFDRNLIDFESEVKRNTEKEKKKNEKLGSKLIRKTRNYRSHKNCTICLDGMYDLLSSRLVCNHVFHHKCIIKWFREGKPECPICRNAKCE
jgi:hypothetical protein